MATINWSAAGSAPLDSTGIYGTSLNWVGSVVPGVDDIAQFRNSHHSGVLVNADAQVAGWIFSGTTTYTANIAAHLFIGSSGIVGIVSIVNTGELDLRGTGNFGFSTTSYVGTTGILNFDEQSSAGGSAISIHAGSEAYFYGTSTAAQATLANAGMLWFSDHATAGAAHVSNTGDLEFFSSANAGTATLANYASLTFNHSSSAGTGALQNISNGSTLTFTDNATASHALLSNVGQVSFEGTSTGGTATIINDGRVTFNDASSAGSATIQNRVSSIVFNDGSTADGANVTSYSNAFVQFSGASTAGHASFNGGNINFTERSTGGTASFNIAAGNFLAFSGTAGTNNDHHVSAGTLNGTGTIYLGANVLTISGGNFPGAFGGVITDTIPTFHGPGSLVKTGTFTQQLGGASTYSGSTTILQGELQLDGSVATGVAISGGTLSGTGTVAGVVTVGAMGTLDPGNSVGRLTMGGLVMTAGATLASYVSVVGDAYDQAIVHGTVALNGATLNLMPSFGFDPGSTRTPYTLVDNDGTDTVAGHFAGLSEGQYFSVDNRVFSIAYRGGTGNDVVVTSDGVVIDGTDGKDTINATHVPGWQPYPTALNDIIRGLGGKDKLAGLGGDDTLVGGAGKDAINGGKGNDTADYGDKTKGVSVTLNGSHAATVKVGGKAEDTLKNVESLTGSSNNDKFIGDGTDNHFDGGLGKDVLKGGAGKDQFVFSVAAGKADADAITDFKHHSDKIALDDAIFAAIGDKLEKGELYAQAGAHKAHDGDDRIIYDKSNGHLYYDADGSTGPAAALLFATLTNHPDTLKHGDFVIV